MTYETDDLRIESLNELSSPKSVREEIPISDEVASIVYNSRLALSKILDFEDDRLILIVSPRNFTPDSLLIPEVPSKIWTTTILWDVSKTWPLFVDPSGSETCTNSP